MNELTESLMLLGLRRHLAHFLALLLVLNKEISLRELSQLSGYAKSRISEIMKALEDRGLVEVRIIKKRSYYRVKVNELKKLIEEKERKLLELKDFLDKCGEGEGA